MSEKPTTRIVVTVVSGLILAGLIFIFKSYLPLVLSWVWSVTTTSWNWLFSTHPVSGWLIVVLGAALLTVLAGVARRLCSGDPIAADDWRSFTDADFHGFHWRWQYDYSGSLSYLVPFCADRSCDLQLHPKRTYGPSGQDGTEMKCKRCGYTKFLSDDPVTLDIHIRHEIQRLLRTDQWRSLVNNEAPK